MNNKGQVLVLFIMLLPITFLLIYLVYSQIFLYGEKKNQQDFAYRLCNYYKDGKSINDLEDISKENDNETSLEIKELNQGIEITLVKVVKDIINKENKIKTVITCN